MAPGRTLTASVRVRDSGPLTFSWYLVGGSPGLGGAATQILQQGTNPQAYGGATSAQVGADLPGTTSQSTTDGVTTGTISFAMPTPVDPGNNYQLRVIVADAAGGGATAAVAFEMTETSAALASEQAVVQPGSLRMSLGCHHAPRCAGFVLVQEGSGGRARLSNVLAAGFFALPRGIGSVDVPLTRSGRRRLSRGTPVEATAHLTTPHAGRILRDRQPLTLVDGRR